MNSKDSYPEDDDTQLDRGKGGGRRGSVRVKAGARGSVSVRSPQTEVVVDPRMSVLLAKGQQLGVTKTYNVVDKMQVYTWYYPEANILEV